MEEQFQKRSFLDSKTVDLERFRFGIAPETREARQKQPFLNYKTVDSERFRFGTTPEAGRQARNDRFYIIERSIWNIFGSEPRRRPGGRPETIVFEL